MKVSVVYAKHLGGYIEKNIEVHEGCSVRLAIERSKICAECDEINLSENTVGIFSRRVNLEDILQAGDRIEIYRPLKIDPKAARLQRAKKRQSSSK